MREEHLHPALSLRGALMLVVAIIPVIIASFAGQLFSAPAINGWYATLNKPFFNPPNVVFPLVWTFLFALMAVAFWRILRAKPIAGPIGGAVAIFLVHLIVNVGWSYAFFGLRSPVAGLLVVSVLLLMIALTMRAFIRIDRAAGYALFPYLAWTAFAMILNAAIVILNR